MKKVTASDILNGYKPSLKGLKYIHIDISGYLTSRLTYSDSITGDTEFKINLISIRFILGVLKNYVDETELLYPHGTLIKYDPTREHILESMISYIDPLCVDRLSILDVRHVPMNELLVITI